jgi:hypothetical protein
MAGPTAEAIVDQDLEAQWEGFYPYKLLGTGVNAKGPDGEVWTKYDNGLMERDLRPAGMYEPKPQFGQTVTLSYVGTFAETGKEFDRSPADKPLTFRMGSKTVIEGLSLGLVTMRSGGKRKIYVPAELGYGAAGTDKIPGGSALVFEVELLKVTGSWLPIPWNTELPKAEPLGPPVPKGMKVEPTEPATGPDTAPATAPATGP